MATFTYNGISLPYPLITSFQQEAVGDDISNTDWAYTKFDITVQCVLNAAYLGLVAPTLISGGNPVTDNPALIMKLLRSQLLKRRRALSITFNGVELIPQPTAVVTDDENSVTGTVDARNGPIPISCTIMDMTNVTFLMVFRITAHYWENNTVNPANPVQDDIVTNQTGNNVLFNRWTESVDIDNCNYTTVSRDGKFVIRSDNPTGQIVDKFRSQMAILGVPPGFLRESSHYTVSPDGLALQYRVTDKEVFKMPPDPAFTADGDYYESAPVRGGQIIYLECRVRLKGAKDTDQSELIQTALNVAATKIRKRGKVRNPTTGFNIMESAGVRVKLYENEVEVTLKAMATPDNKRVFTLDGFYDMSTETPLSTDADDYSPNYPIRGTANQLIQAAAYYDPSLKSIKMGSDGQLVGVAGGLEVGQAGANKEP